MGWAVWLRDFALFGLTAAGLVFVLRTARARTAVAKLRDTVTAWTPRRALAIVLLLTIASRAAGLAAFEPPFEADVREYVEKAAAIADDGHPRRLETKGDGHVFYRPLGSSLALAGWFLATGTRGLLSARVHGIALAALAAWLLLALGRTIGRVPEGRIAALAWAVFLPHVVFATIPYTETFVTVLVLAISVLFERLRRDVGGCRCAAGLGLLGGWLAITRSEIAWFGPLALGLLAWDRRAELGAALATAAVGSVLFVAPIAVNHEMRSGYPGHLRTSVQGGLILYFGNNPIEVNGYGNATPAVQARVRELYASDATGGLARDEALAWMSAHPLAAIANAPKKAFHLWLAEPQGFRWHAAAGHAPSGMAANLARVLRSLAYVQSLLVLTLGVAGWRSLGRARRYWCWTLWLHLGVWCLLAASTRNRYPFEPWLLLAAAGVTAGSASTVRSHGSARGGAGVQQLRSGSDSRIGLPPA